MVSLLIGVSLNAGKPALRDAARGWDSAAERMAVRQLSATLAKAVRGMVGGADQHKPGFNVAMAMAPVGPECGVPAVAEAELAAPGVALLRPDLLDLPPPRA